MSDDYWNYTSDREGNAVYAGDYVRCVDRGYSSIRYLEQRRVKRVEGNCIVMHNDDSPRTESPYRASNFLRCGKHHPAHKGHQQEKTMLHIAIMIGTSQVQASIADIAAEINMPTIGQKWLAGVTKEEIQERIRTRLSMHPDEKWLICSGHTLGERADPPVRFRSV